MHSYIVKKYNIEYKSQWNTFIANAKNATFLLNRNFMEYHNDRFNDHSLLVFKREKLIAIVPANKVDNTLYSHQGLTYGGFIISNSLKLNETVFAFKSVLEFLETNGISNFIVKMLPSIYSTWPSEEMEYLSFLLKGKLIRQDVLSVINNSAEKITISTVRKRGVKKAKFHKLIIKEESNFDLFWNTILTPNLERKYNKKPVHSLEEIKLLHSRFSKNIRQFNVYKESKIVAGTTIFETKNVAHAQYISASENKQELGSLDFLFQHLITVVFKDKMYFDFGISNEDSGKKMNKGLLYWKESFGARTITQDFYSFETKNHIKLAHVLE